LNSIIIYQIIKFTRENGFLSYYEICKKLKEGWALKWDDSQMVPYTYMDDQWIGFDNIKSLTIKVNILSNKE
jgi:chitinase